MISALIESARGATRSRPTAARSASADGVEALRRSGVALLAILGWAMTAVVVLVEAALGRDSSMVLLVAALLNLGPSWVALRGRSDAEACLMAGTLAAAMPALLVYALRGHGWQMDAHMYFFVALAVLTVLCDWRPIALASTLIALHHVGLELLAPTFVFRGDGNAVRVLFHAAAIIAQFAVLAYVTQHLARLLRARDAAVADSARLVEEAQTARGQADTALAAATAAERDAERERAQNRDQDSRHAETRRRELLSLAAGFEHSVAAIVVTIEDAATRLAESSTVLDEVSSAAGREAVGVAANATDAASEIKDVAGAISTLGLSIGSIASAAEQQRGLSVIGRERGARSAETVAALATRAEQIGAFVDQIRGIVGKTSLLSLNATIEAARAGEAGRGFAVVAGEVKALARETERLSDSIVAILGDVGASIDLSRLDADKVNEAVAEVSDAADGIAADAANQSALVQRIGISAASAASSAGGIRRSIEDLACSVSAAVALSSNVRQSTSALSITARELRQSSENFVRHLRDETVGIAAL